jgi:hypothetical protein
MLSLLGLFMTCSCTCSCLRETIRPVTAAGALPAGSAGE